MKNDVDLIRGRLTASLLIVDDSASTRLILKTILGKFHKVYLATDGIEAISTLNENPAIDLILLDVYMPVLGGMDTIRHLKRNSPKLLKDKKVIVMSAWSEEKLVKEARQLKADGWLCKPVQKEEVLKLVHTLIGRIQA